MLLLLCSKVLNAYKCRFTYFIGVKVVFDRLSLSFDDYWGYKYGFIAINYAM